MASWLAALVLTGSLTAQDWPQHRGANRDARLPDVSIAAEWSEETEVPSVAWRRDIGESFSGVAVVGHRFYTLFADETTEYLGAFGVADGSELWRLPLGDRFVDNWGDGGRSTPTIDRGKVFALGSYGRLVAVDATSGELNWHVDLPELDDVKPPDFGYSPSPLVVGNLVVLEVGGSEKGLVGAFDRTSGGRVWAASGGRAGYSSPILVKTPGTDESTLVFMTRESVLGLTPQGRESWSWPLVGGSEFDLPIAMPIDLGNGRVFASHRAEGGSVALTLPRRDGESAEVLWESEFMKIHLNAGVVSDGLLYGFHNATLKAVRAESGELVWARRGLGKGSVIALGARLVVLSDDGLLVLLEAGAESYVELGRHQALDERNLDAPKAGNGAMATLSSTALLSYGTAGNWDFLSTRSGSCWICPTRRIGLVMKLMKSPADN